MQNSFATPEQSIVARASTEATTKCRVCRTAVPASGRWCPHCGLNTMSHVHGRLASPARRLSATALDYVIPVGAFVATSSLADGSDILELVLLVYAAWVLILFSGGTTPGKRLVGIRVINEDGFPATLGRMVAREWIGKVISACICGLGYVGIVTDGERRALHDRMVHTYVIG